MSRQLVDVTVCRLFGAPLVSGVERGSRPFGVAAAKVVVASRTLSMLGILMTQTLVHGSIAGGSDACPRAVLVAANARGIASAAMSMLVSLSRMTSNLLCVFPGIARHGVSCEGRSRSL